MGEPKHLGLIGFPLKQSVSKKFQQAALDYYSISACYDAWEVDADQLETILTSLRNQDKLGANVTVPYKEKVIPYLDRIQGFAEECQAVNTIVNADGKLIGYNTDGVGFITALKEDCKFLPMGKKALVIGAGGSAKAVALALASEGASEINILNRNIRNGGNLARLLSKLHPSLPTQVIGFDSDILTPILDGCDIIVNCTILGMKHGPAENASPLKADQIPTGTLVFDLVYNPSLTKFMDEANLAGVSNIGGLSMLVYQGAASFELWTGRKAPMSVMLESARTALGEYSI